jgi:thymidylate synthase
MPQAISVLRKGHADNIARAFGLKTGQPTTTVGDQHIQSAEHADVLKLPVDGTNWKPLQILDPSDPNFGKTIFLPDVDFPDDPDKVVL